MVKASPQPHRRKRIAVLGATGSVGRQVLDVIAQHPERYQAHALVCHRQALALAELGRRHGAKHLLALEPSQDCPRSVRNGAAALEEILQDPDIDLVVVGIAGAAALRPTLAAIEAGHDIAIATKEVLVMAGGLVMEAARRHKVRVLPVDSEHSAIWQALLGEDPAGVHRLLLTASGGPFWQRPLEALAHVTVAEALAHPRWRMGKKISVDSATMMNKGLEILEAHCLFGVPYDAIDVVIHPQSIVHSLVEFVDGASKAQLGIPDMRVPIALALSYPERLPRIAPPVDLVQVGKLEFFPLDPTRFPAVGLARAAGRAGGRQPAVLNAANEAAVELFLAERIPFTRIPVLVEEALSANPERRGSTLGDMLEADAWARQFVVQASLEAQST
jgi:1-deoxy-D-xylulose-5-phosphate reductoisomerase